MLQVTNTSIAARLGSAVALNGTNGLTGGPLNMNGVSYTTISITTPGAVTTHTAEPGSSPVAWGNWLTTSSTTAPSDYEEHFTSRFAAPAISGTPGNPTVAAYAAPHAIASAQVGGAGLETVRTTTDAIRAPSPMPNESANKSPHSQKRPGTNCCKASIRPP
jgi:hypothetical protein